MGRGGWGPAQEAIRTTVGMRTMSNTGCHLGREAINSLEACRTWNLLLGNCCLIGMLPFLIINPSPNLSLQTAFAHHGSDVCFVYLGRSKHPAYSNSALCPSLPSPHSVQILSLWIHVTTSPVGYASGHWVMGAFYPIQSLGLQSDLLATVRV